MYPGPAESTSRSVRDERTHRSVSVVWLKRDLRLKDHEPLCAAIARGQPILMIYCFEPTVTRAPDYSELHLRFIAESLDEMNETLQPFRAQVWVFYREITEVLKDLKSTLGVFELYSHEETGNLLTYARDRQVKRLCKSLDVTWRETPHSGVIRGLKNRAEWDRRWLSYMERSLADPPLNAARWCQLDAEWYTAHKGTPPIVHATEHRWLEAEVQRGGTAEARLLCRSFFTQRIWSYQRHISKPTESRTSCSRLSPYLAWGNISTRQLYHTYHRFLKSKKPSRAHQAFISRLWWRSHFIQKLESEPELEEENMNRAFNEIRTQENMDFIRAWETGHTGYPLVDATMRCLIHTGYLNFRMRAMLVSFLCHHLWQDWRSGALHLARHFLDYEPGIHYPQLQMQASSTGVNAVRVYNPVKQAQDHDPEGVFIRRWIPELACLPTPLVHQPWTTLPMDLAMYHDHQPLKYPQPIVDLSVSGSHARRTLWSIKRSEAARQANIEILKRHVSTRRKSI